MSIYFLLSADRSGAILKEDLVKIGYSAGNTPRRLYDVGTGCPFELELYAVIPGDKRREKAIHKRFAKYHVHREWFFWNDEIEEWVDNAEIDATLAEMKQKGVTATAEQLEDERRRVVRECTATLPVRQESRTGS